MDKSLLVRVRLQAPKYLQALAVKHFSPSKSVNVTSRKHPAFPWKKGDQCCAGSGPSEQKSQATSQWHLQHQRHWNGGKTRNGHEGNSPHCKILCFNVLGDQSQEIMVEGSILACYGWTCQVMGKNCQCQCFRISRAAPSRASPVAGGSFGSHPKTRPPVHPHLQFPWFIYLTCCNCPERMDSW